ncbi:MAG: 30S ribosome-binding factor RbfA [Rikenellaceae bacterium]|nr:30S ribosome-binding factor RbfA [Rikenellaceae bacterium]MBQ9147156.1 30S ribosome-binding factor RbfA [Rikenellaceae bacterium]MBR2049752.1 30S ribosome-binding factor RbfA [Rikenellaceae bacterium]MBR2420361.1 30S ribosome-binding factor RbfA [Rikenellaceae bacterium]MBR2931189.1 30S ribosome-binding factor RbfA [Rikenellaceae bacterium]
MESTRQAKMARQIQKDVAEILLKEAASLVRGVMASVTTVRVSPDLNYAKIYFSIFPFEKSAEVMRTLDENNWLIRRALGQRIRNQVKSVPELQFFLDDSLEYIANIDTLLKEE